MTAPTPPNDGAHRLAWWLLSKKNRVNRLLKRLDTDRVGLERMLDGQIVPLARTAETIAMATAGAVLPEDWDLRAGGGWLDRPAPRPAANDDISNRSGRVLTRGAEGGR